MKYLVAMLLLFASGSTLASCLSETADFAERICGEIVTNGKDSVINAEGELNAGLEGSLKLFLGEIGGKGSIDISKSSYESVIRSDLHHELSDLRECRMKMVQVGINDCPQHVSVCGTFVKVGKQFGDTYVPDNSPNCPNKLHTGRAHYAKGDPVSICKSKVVSITSAGKISVPEGSDCGTVGSMHSTYLKLHGVDEEIWLRSNCKHVATSLNFPANGCTE